MIRQKEVIEKATTNSKEFTTMNLMKSDELYTA